MSNERSLPRLMNDFWARLTPTTQGCLEYPQGQRNHDGYGRLSWSHGLVKVYNERAAHRVAWLISQGRVDYSKQILHTCDNPPCCNPAHLYEGSGKDNMQEKLSKGRGGDCRRKQIKPCPDIGKFFPCASCGIPVEIDSKSRQRGLERYGRVTCSRSCSARLAKGFFQTRQVVPPPLEV